MMKNFSKSFSIPPPHQRHVNLFVAATWKHFAKGDSHQFPVIEPDTKQSHSAFWDCVCPSVVCVYLEGRRWVMFSSHLI